MSFDWKMASIIGMMIPLGLNIVIVESPLVVFFSVLAIPLFNWVAHIVSWRILTGQWVYKSCVVARINKHDGRVYYAAYCLIDGKDFSHFFFGDGAKSRADEFLKKVTCGKYIK